MLKNYEIIYLYYIFIVSHAQNFSTDNIISIRNLVQMIADQLNVKFEDCVEAMEDIINNGRCHNQYYILIIPAHIKIVTGYKKQYPSVLMIYSKV